MKGAWYNENDRQKAAWLRHLIEEGVIAPGVVDERSILEVRAEDLAGFTQAHWFAGIGIWSLALRLAGWPDDRPVWTGSCPCGPFSIAGRRKGFDDPRHLWPAWLPLIRERRPDVLFGEQSDAADAWIDLVSTDLEDCGYAVGAPVISAAGFGGAHIRRRFYWMADANNAEWWSERAPWHDGRWPKTGRVKGDGHAGHGGADGWLADADCGPEPGRGVFRPGESGQASDGISTRVRVAGFRSDGGLGDAQSGGRGEFGRQVDARDGRHADGAVLHDRLGEPGGAGLSDAQFGIVRRPGWLSQGRAVEQPSDPPGARVDWLFCRDRRWRPVGPGLAPLVDAHPARMALLRGFGDALDVETAAQFVAAYLEVAP